MKCEGGWKKNRQRKIEKEKSPKQNRKRKMVIRKIIFWWATGSSKTTDRDTVRTKRALRKNDARDTRRTKKMWQRGTGKRSRVFSATLEGFLWK